MVFEMAKLVAISCVLVFVLLGSTASNVDKFRIIGGTPAKPGQFPFLVSLQYYGRHFCGGSIIAKDIVLTAAHCVDGKSARYMTIVAGTNNLHSGGMRIAASRITQHHGYTAAASDSDVALIFLSTPLTYSDTIKPAELPSESEDYHDSQDYVTVAGWGTVSQQSSTTSISRYTKIPLWGREICRLVIPRITKNMICAGSFDGQQNACPGDSGGPLFIGNKVIGTVSFGFGCGRPNAPAVYASVANLRSWISENAKV